MSSPCSKTNPSNSTAQPPAPGEEMEHASCWGRRKKKGKREPLILHGSSSGLPPNTFDPKAILASFQKLLEEYQSSSFQNGGLASLKNRIIEIESKGLSSFSQHATEMDKPIIVNGQPILQEKERLIRQIVQDFINVNNSAQNYCSISICNGTSNTKEQKPDTHREKVSSSGQKSKEYLRCLCRLCCRCRTDGCEILWLGFRFCCTQTPVTPQQALAAMVIFLGLFGVVAFSNSVSEIIEDEEEGLNATLPPMNLSQPHNHLADRPYTWEITAGLVGSFILVCFAVGCYAYSHRWMPAQIGPFNNYRSILRKNGDQEPLKFRRRIIDMIFNCWEVNVLGQSSQRSHPLLVGEAGVGKSEILKEITRQIAFGKVNKRYEKCTQITDVYMTTAAFLTTSSADQMQTGEKIQHIVKTLENKKEEVIIILDDLHAHLGDLDTKIRNSEYLKYLLDTFPFVIASTITSEYTKLIQNNSTLHPRFHRITVGALDDDDIRGNLKVIASKHQIPFFDPSRTVKIFSDQETPILDSVIEYIYTKAQGIKNQRREFTQPGISNELLNRTLIAIKQSQNPSKSTEETTQNSSDSNIEERRWLESNLEAFTNKMTQIETELEQCERKPKIDQNEFEKLAWEFFKTYLQINTKDYLSKYAENLLELVDNIVRENYSEDMDQDRESRIDKPPYLMGRSQAEASQSTSRSDQDIHAPDNAFNQFNNMRYPYQGTDILYIGRNLMKQFGNRAKFVGALGQGNDFVNAISVLRKNKEKYFDLDKDKILLGVYNTGGNHWIAFAISQKGSNLQIKYKDSLGSPLSEDFEDDIKGAFNGAGTRYDFTTDPSREQNEDPLVSCGLFALKNMEIFATMDHWEPSKFFRPNKVNYNANLQELRKSFAVKYAISVHEESKNVLMKEAIREAFYKQHQSENDFLKAKLLPLNSNVSAEVTLNAPVTLKRTLDYHYRITCGESDKVLCQNLLSQLAIPVNELIEREDKVVFQINPKNVKDIELKRLIVKNNIIHPEISEKKIEESFIQSLNLKEEWKDDEIRKEVQRHTGIDLSKSLKHSSNNNGPASSTSITTLSDEEGSSDVTPASDL
ncbi:MAG: AAA family ATPase [Chlamydiales bacterium]